MLCPLPPVPKQKEIVSSLSRKTEGANSLQRSLQDQLNTIKQLPAALLRQAFNGEL
jgi:type I restriction enzyme, S subunit